MIEEVHVQVETITPLYTGNAYGNMGGIKPQSIIGSLRFWFETYLLAMNKDRGDADVNVKEFREKIIEYTVNKKFSLEGATIKARQEQKTFSLSSYLFGCTGLKGLIEIKKMEDVSSMPYNENTVVEVEQSKWYLPKKHYEESFSITFSVENSIKEKIFFPLLHFIQKYGYIGAKDNLGYGRVKFEVEGKGVANYIQFDFSDFLTDDRKWMIDEAVEEVEEFESLYTLDKIGLYKDAGKNATKNDNKVRVKKFMQVKSQKRKDFNNLYKSDEQKQRGYKREENRSEASEREIKNYVFGIVNKNENQGSKILPWTNEKNEFGFLSLVFLDREKLTILKKRVKK